MRLPLAGLCLAAVLFGQGATITITNESLPRSTPKPAAAPSSPWEQRCLASVNRLRAQQGKRALVLDPLLSRGAAAQARYLADLPRAQLSQLSSRALSDVLWRSGAYDGNPTVRFIVQGEREDVPANHAKLRGVADEEASHLGIGTVVRNGARYVALATVERRVELAGLDPGPHAPFAHLWLRGRLLAGNRNPRLLVTPPAGPVQEVPLGTRDSRFEHLLELGQGRGRYMVEIMVDGRQGPAVAALVALDVGAAAPPPVARTQAPAKREGLAAMRTHMLALVNADRARHGLPPLTLSEGLSRMAQGHSEDMRAHRFFAHVSPTRGELRDRADAAGLPGQSLGENIAMAGSLEEAEENLMASPGHRAMILHPEMHFVGFGIVTGGDAGESAPQMWITQNYGTDGP